MSRDPFGHIAAARHFQNVARQRGWKDEVERIERKIQHLEKSEAEFWQWVEALADKWSKTGLTDRP